MKKLVLTFFSIAACAAILTAQIADCSKIFISEYVEGYGSNRAIELYNPTPNAINLNNYSIGRFRDGSITFSGIQIPFGNTIQPYKTFVIVLDKRDTLAVGQEVAIWDGYQKWDVCRDSLGNVLFQTNGDTLRCVQYNAAGVPLRSYVYNSFLDLKSKANLFLTPIYEVSTSAMYFNGDDAVAVIEGTNATAASILDVVGVIGIDPGFSWLDAQGGRLTQDKTLQRKDNVRGGTGPVSIQSVPDTFAYNRWIVRGKDTFTGLGTHRCTCEPGIISSVEAVGEVAFSVAPNPIRQGSDLFIEAAQPVQSVAFYNLLGQLISTQNITDTNGRFTCSVPNDLSSGLYLIQLTFTDQRISTRKISVE